MERLPRYWGKRVEKELTSSMPPSFQDGSNFSIFQWSMLGSSSHGLGLSCFPFRRQFFPSGASAAAAAALASSSDAMAELKRARVSWGLEERSSRMRRGRSPCRLGLVALVAAGGDEEDGDGNGMREEGLGVLGSRGLLGFCGATMITVRRPRPYNFN